ncbi:nuclease (SNase domain protein) [sediment metagenome]|uniref:Nuclease (SNase domain protein) n=1 Tax=sediment metagenome TaxID=749907 RepID=D9PMV9_9ZZZZ
MNLKTKKLFFTIFILFVFLLGFYLGGENKQVFDNKENTEIIKYEEQKIYKVLDVIDGDTIKINYYNNLVSLRVIGINTPEKEGSLREQECFGNEASDKAEELLFDKNIFIELDESQSKFDKYGRLLAYVFFENGDDFGLEMIESGFAYEYTYQGREYKNQNIYKEAQKYAEKNQLGL